MQNFYFNMPDGQQSVGFRTLDGAISACRATVCMHNLTSCLVYDNNEKYHAEVTRSGVRMLVRKRKGGDVFKVLCHIVAYSLATLMVLLLFATCGGTRHAEQPTQRCPYSIQ